MIQKCIYTAKFLYAMNEAIWVLVPFAGRETSQLCGAPFWKKLITFMNI